MRGRGTDTDEVINQRLKNAAREISEAGWYDYLVVNDDFQTALNELSAIVTAERCRGSRNNKVLAELTIKGEK